MAAVGEVGLPPEAEDEPTRRELPGLECAVWEEFRASFPALLPMVESVEAEKRGDAGGEGEGGWS